MYLLDKVSFFLTALYLLCVILLLLLSVQWPLIWVINAQLIPYWGLPQVTRMHTHTYTHAHTHTHTHTHTHSCTHTHTHTHSCTHTHTHTQSCTHTHTQSCAHTHMDTLTCAHSHTHARTYMHVHTYMHAEMHTHTHIHTCTHRNAHTLDMYAGFDEIYGLLQSKDVRRVPTTTALAASLFQSSPWVYDCA